MRVWMITFPRSLLVCDDLIHLAHLCHMDLTDLLVLVPSRFATAGQQQGARHVCHQRGQYLILGRVQPPWSHQLTP
jgi:hypothetical protein